MNNFKSQPVGRSVLYVSAFTFGKHSHIWNKLARLEPTTMTSLASIIYEAAKNKTESEIRERIHKITELWENYLNLIESK